MFMHFIVILFLFALVIQWES